MAAFALTNVEDPVVRLRLFGRLEAVSYSGESVLPRGRKAQAILCYLALSGKEPIPRQRLVDLLWSSRWGEQGRASLRQSVLELRTGFRPLVDGVLVIERDFIQLNQSQVWIDGINCRNDDVGERSAAARAPIETLLETLVGLDPKFDEWIYQVRREFAALHDQEAIARKSASPHPLRDASESPDPPLCGLSIGVAPLLVVGAGVVDDYLAQALTQEIITALARFRWIRVCFSASTQLDAHYVLEGYISCLGNEYRLVLRLIDQTDRGLIAWTGSARMSLPLQSPAIEQIVERVIAELDPEILAIETRKVLRRPVASPDSYECVLRALPLLYGFDISSWRNATALLARAVETDPQNGRAFAFSALCRATGLAQGWVDDADRELRCLDQDAERAIACDPRDSLGLALSAHIKSFLHHDFDSARALFDRAVRANPSCGFSWGYSSLTYAYIGQTEEAMARLVRAQAIMIHDPYSSFMDAFYAVITYFSHDWPETVAACRRQLKRRPAFTNMRKLLVGALCFAGDIQQAQAEHERLLQDEPEFTWARHLISYPFGLEADRLALQDALQDAGLMPSSAFAVQPARPRPAAHRSLTVRRATNAQREKREIR